MEENSISKNVRPSEAEIEAWKSQYGNIMIVEVPRENERGEPEAPYTICFKPTIKDKMATFTLAQKEANAGKPFQFAKVILGAYIINGKDVLQEDNDLLIALLNVAQKIFEKGQAIIKNL